MKIGNKSAVERELTRAEKIRKSNIKKIIISFTVAILMFILLIIIQYTILHQEEKQKAFQFVADVESGTKITEDNFGKYIGEAEVFLSLIPENSISDKTEVIGKFLNRNYKAKDILTKDGLTDTEKLYKDTIDNPVEISFAVDSLANADAGKIREGDYVNIYALDVNETSAYHEIIVSPRYTFRHVYIAGAYSSDGTAVPSEDKETTATIFKIILSEKDIASFTESLANCQLKVSKLLYDTSTNYQEFLNEMISQNGLESPEEEDSRKVMFWEEDSNTESEVQEETNEDTEEEQVDEEDENDVDENIEDTPIEENQQTEEAVQPEETVQPEENVEQPVEEQQNTEGEAPENNETQIDNGGQ